MSESIFISHTQQLLQQRPRNVTYEKIAQDTGLTTRWLSAFASCNSNSADDSTDFGALKVEKLYTYLSGKTLTL